jgi:hypothetical protein
MTSRFSLLVTIGLFVGIAIDRPAHADPVQVTSGSATARFGGASGFAFFSADDFLLASAFVGFSRAPWDVCRSGCVPGTTVDLTTVMGGDLPFQFALGGGFLTSARIDDVSYGCGSPTSCAASTSEPLGLAGTLNFNVESIIVPPLPGPGLGGINVTVPFTLTGQAIGYAVSDRELRNPLFHVELFGSGEARFTALNSAPGATFTFGTPAPVPEPATIVLLVTGLAGLMCGLRRRRIGVFSRVGAQ